MPADDVYQGVDVAVHYMIGRGLDLGAEVLIPERDWDHPTMTYQALIDLVSVQEEGDEEYSQRVLEVTDYKTSWQADADELNTLQRWGQAVVMWRVVQNKPLQWHAQPTIIDIIRQRVVNLRTWQEFTRDINLTDPDDIAELERWEQRINTLCMTAHNTKSPVDGRRPAAPGAGCLSCAYRHICPEAWPLNYPGDLTLQQLAEELAIIEGQKSKVIAMLKAADVEKPIPIEGGVVGFKEQVRRVFQAGKEVDILSEWLTACACELPEQDINVLVSLLAALKLGKGNLDAFSKALMSERRKGIAQARAEYVETLTTEKRISLFGVWPNE